jgi:hypothetical protein
LTTKVVTSIGAEARLFRRFFDPCIQAEHAHTASTGRKPGFHGPFLSFTSEHSKTLRCFTAISVLLARVILPSHDLPFVPLSNSGREHAALRGEPSNIARYLPLFKSPIERPRSEKGPQRTGFFVLFQASNSTLLSPCTTRMWPG